MGNYKLLAPNPAGNQADIVHFAAGAAQGTICRTDFPSGKNLRGYMNVEDHLKVSELFGALQH